MNTRPRYPIPELGLNRRRQHPLDGPAALDPIVQVVNAHSESFGPSRQRERHAVVRQRVIVAPVPLLLFPRGPSAIAGLVIPVIVDPIQRGAGRPFAHVSVEALECLPALTDGDPTGAITGVTLGASVQAPQHHGVPGSVRQRTTQAKLRRDPNRSTRSGTSRPLSCGAGAHRDGRVAHGANQHHARRILTGHQVTPGVNPGQLALRRGTLRSSILPYPVNVDSVRHRLALSAQLREEPPSSRPIVPPVAGITPGAPLT